MAILHKFDNEHWGDHFATHDTILQNVPYFPEVMILGTFNPDTPNAIADFFYGRNYFWPAFKNLFVENASNNEERRMPLRGAIPQVLNPTLDEILILCNRLKLTFADLIQGVLHQDNPAYHLLPNDHVMYGRVEYNLVQDGKQKGICGLAQLDNLDQVNWNTDNIIDYLCRTPSIHTIYFTRQPTGVWEHSWRKLKGSDCVKSRTLTNIFTPSGQGKPVYHSMGKLLNHWVHNVNPSFGSLNNQWLQENGVNTANF